MSRVTIPLEVKSAGADTEAVIAGGWYTKQLFDAPNVPLNAFVSIYRDFLLVSGWKLLELPRIEEGKPAPEGTINIAAQYSQHGHNIYARISRDPNGSYEVNVADVGEEDWSAMLAKECKLLVPSIHFDLDRPTIRLFESEPTLQKLADVLKGRNAPAVEIQGHMDNIGEAGVAARQALSEARAKAVAAWLTAHGVPAAKVTSKGYGKTRPIADNDSDLGRAMNRRIEVACISGQ